MNTINSYMSLVPNYHNHNQRYLGEQGLRVELYGCPFPLFHYIFKNKFSRVEFMVPSNSKTASFHRKKIVKNFEYLQHKN